MQYVRGMLTSFIERSAFVFFHFFRFFVFHKRLRCSRTWNKLGHVMRLKKIFTWRIRMAWDPYQNPWFFDEEVSVVAKKKKFLHMIVSNWFPHERKIESRQNLNASLSLFSWFPGLESTQKLFYSNPWPAIHTATCSTPQVPTSYSHICKPPV